MSEDIPDTSEFGSVDPAPPSGMTDVGDLREILCNEESKMLKYMLTKVLLFQKSIM